MSTPAPMSAPQPIGRRVTIEVSLDVDLSEDEVWPDGAPDNWTADDVVREVEKCGSLRTFLEDWNADLFGADFSVHLDGRVVRGRLS